MTAGTGNTSSGQLAGHNRINAAALGSIAKMATAKAFDVSAADVRVSFADDGGLLALSVAVPIGIPPLMDVVHNPAKVAALGGTVWDRAVAAKGIIGATVGELTGSELSRVDIRITGAKHVTGRRVQ
ncbi:MAG: hypothetical protein HIU81_00255 [Acidobacteria bacterium]|nr:hypothetical protein [Acidobacteriota bacterium]